MRRVFGLIKIEKLLLRSLRILLFTTCCLFCAASSATDKVFVAVASSMRLAWSDWLAATAVSVPGSNALDVATSFSSSGNLARQIRQGAPLELFISASVQYVDVLQNPKNLVAKSAAFAAGELAIVVLKNGPLADAAEPEVLEALLSASPEAFESLSPLRISLANPRHAPYGIAATQVLEKTDPSHSHQRLLAENASQAVQFLSAGGADIAIVPLSLLISRSQEYLWRRVDSHLYQPVVHHLVLLEGASQGAAEIFESLLQPQALDALQTYGFRPIGATELAK